MIWRDLALWALLALVIGTPVALAAVSPLLAWRDPVYIIAGFAGIVAMGIMLVQPLLGAAALPRISLAKGRWIHRRLGALLVIAILLHVAGLWITSPPDVIDALMFTSPTPFSAWGVIALWAILAAAAIALLRRPLRLRWRTWQISHLSLVTIAVAGTIVHAVLITGTMETLSKLVLCGALIAATVNALVISQVWRSQRKTR